MSYDNTNTFTLFINDKGDNDKRPDRTGTLNVDGVEYFIDGWIKQGSKGPFLSGKIKPKEKQPGSAPAQQPEMADDDLQF